MGRRSGPGRRIRCDQPPTRLVAASARWQAAELEQFQSEGLDLGEHAVQRGLVRQRSRQHGVRAALLSLQARKR